MPTEEKTDVDARKEELHDYLEFRIRDYCSEDQAKVTFQIDLDENFQDMCFNKMEEIKLRKVVQTPEQVANSFYPLLEKFDELLEDPRVQDILHKFDLKHHKDKAADARQQVVKKYFELSVDELEAAEEIAAD